MRRFLTLLVILIGVGVSLALMFSGAKPANVPVEAAAESEASQEKAEGPEAAGRGSEGQVVEGVVESLPGLASGMGAGRLDVPVTAIEGLHVVPVEAKQPEPLLGGLEDIGASHPYAFNVVLTPYGGGIKQVRLAGYSQEVDQKEHLIIQERLPYERRTGADGEEVQTYRYPMAAHAVTVNGMKVFLYHHRWRVIDQVSDPSVGSASVGFELTLADAEDLPVLRLKRRYSVEAKASRFDLRCEQTFENLSGRELVLQWEQYAQGDIPNDDASYLGDQRKLVAGYRDLGYDPNGRFVTTKGASIARKDVLGGTAFWPNENLPEKNELVWLAGLNRYFAVVAHAPTSGSAKQPAGGSAQPIPGLDATFKKLEVDSWADPTGGESAGRVMVFRLISHPVRIAPEGAGHLGLSLFVGPRDSEVYAVEPYKSLGLSELIVYELGCALCTFQWLAKGLLGFLKFLHSVTADWGVAIVILVLCVRLILHPITKKSQINMMKMGKQMQALQPEIEKLKKKYKDDQQKFQQEQVKLFREKGVNPANMLGCLPMFLQTPIWVALYAMLYFAIELRHQPAFYGVFQAVSGGSWAFLADLSSPDNFIRFSGDGFTLPLGFINPHFAGINVIPLLMAVVFFIQQKLTTPPPANEQAAQQQKIMRFMVLLFPVFLYSAPSGLTLYILASTFAGIVDSYVVRQHIKQQEADGTLFDRKPPKPGGFMDRMAKTLEAKQNEYMAKQQGKAAGGKGGRRGGR